MASAQTTIAEDGLLTVEAAAEFLSIGRSLLYAEMDQGRLPYCKIGRARRIPRRALVEFAESRMQGGWAMQQNPQCRAEAQTIAMKGPASV